MKSLRDYLSESEYAYNNPVVGDNFAINVKEECLLANLELPKLDLV